MTPPVNTVAKKWLQPWFLLGGRNPRLGFRHHPQYFEAFSWFHRFERLGHVPNRHLAHLIEPAMLTKVKLDGRNPAPLRNHG